MSKAGEKVIRGLREAVAMAKKKNFLRHWWCYTWSKAERLSESGWRKLFFWSSVCIAVAGAGIAYIYLPLFKQVYLSGDYLTQLNALMVIVTGLAGLRAVEKDRARINGGLVNNEALK